MSRTIEVLMPDGNKVQCYTIAGLAGLSGKSPITLRRWEQKGWLPLCNFRMPSRMIAGAERSGERLYSLKYASKMSDEIRKVTRGEEISEEVIANLHKLFKQERSEFLKK